MWCNRLENSYPSTTHDNLKWAWNELGLASIENHQNSTGTLSIDSPIVDHVYHLPRFILALFIIIVPSILLQVKCMQCSYCSNKFDPFLDLSLEIVRADSLRRALAHFTAKEQLDGGEKQYQCQRCKEKVRALKQLTVHKAPYVLTIHLKRFGSDVPGEKIDRKVDFGPTLDLKPFVSGPYVSISFC